MNPAIPSWSWNCNLSESVGFEGKTINSPCGRRVDKICFRVPSSSFCISNATNCWIEEFETASPVSCRIKFPPSLLTTTNSPDWIFREVAIVSRSNEGRKMTLENGDRLCVLSSRQVRCVLLSRFGCASYHASICYCLAFSPRRRTWLRWWPRFAVC